VNDILDRGGGAVFDKKDCPFGDEKGRHFRRPAARVLKKGQEHRFEKGALFGPHGSLATEGEPGAEKAAEQH